VEGWHYGAEWVNSGALMTRTNFVAGMLSEKDRPGVRSIIAQVREGGSTPEAMVETCLDLLGPIEVSDITRVELLGHASTKGDLSWNDADEEAESASRVSEMLQLVAATREYMFA
jgi:hypothetical protein